MATMTENGGEKAVPKGAGALGAAVATITRGILEGRYVPGQRLVEVDLIEDLGVGRSSVREALRRLEAHGLVESRPNHGARVRAVSASEIRDVYDVRALIETEASRRAALRIDEADHRERMVNAIAALRQARHLDPVAYGERNLEFHGTILQLSCNTEFQRVVNGLRMQTIRFAVGRILSGSVAESAHDEHEVVAERILVGDAAGAAIAMREHIENVANIALSLHSIWGRPSRPAEAP